MLLIVVGSPRFRFALLENPNIPRGMLFETLCNSLEMTVLQHLNEHLVNRIESRNIVVGVRLRVEVVMLTFVIIDNGVKFGEGGVVVATELVVTRRDKGGEVRVVRAAGEGGIVVVEQ
ncbi:uncharacterized protein G2W53_018965 [Senna tora]|uniref:Uncharacterized protein n=1 Tax=Senna tora TaxID=362788 RepID=A0A834TWI1_9FABA|nr:uncharacterized protein G2W53_018965 [Senna tora]